MNKADEVNTCAESLGSYRCLNLGERNSDQGEILLSIAIPTFRRFDLLVEALNSVFSLKFNVAIEVLVVDNDPGNDEDAIKAMLPFSGRNLHYYKNNENVGMFGNWNRCLEISKGRYITILHDDDLLDFEFCEQVNSVFSSNPPYDAIAWRYSLLDQRAEKPTQRNYIEVLRSVKNRLPFFLDSISFKNEVDFFFGNQFVGTLGVIVNRKKALELSGFDSDWYPIADYEFWCRWIISYGPIAVCNKRVSQYRMRENESMRVETREAFVVQSRLLRERMLKEGNVPIFLQNFLDTIQKFQQISINEDWRKDEITLSWVSSLKFVSWRLFSGMIARGYGMTKYLRRKGSVL